MKLLLETPSMLKEHLIEEIKGIFIPTDEELSLGSKVMLEICLPQINQDILLTGTVVWKRKPTKWKSVLRAGIGLKIDEGHAGKWDFLQHLSGGNVAERRKGQKRFDVDFPARVIVDNASFHGQTINVSAGGVFVKMDSPIPIGTEVKVELLKEGAEEPTVYYGTVAWRKAWGDDVGLGIKLAFSQAPMNVKIVDKQNTVGKETMPFIMDRLPGR